MKLQETQKAVVSENLPEMLYWGFIALGWLFILYGVYVVLQ